MLSVEGCTNKMPRRHIFIAHDNFGRGLSVSAFHPLDRISAATFDLLRPDNLRVTVVEGMSRSDRPSQIVAPVEANRNLHDV